MERGSDITERLPQNGIALLPKLAGPDKMTPPETDMALLSNGGDSIRLNFTVPVAVETQAVTRLPSCSGLVEASTLLLLGSEPMCSLDEEDGSILIRLGSGASIVPGDELAVLAASVRNAKAAAGTGLIVSGDGSTALIAPPVDPERPFVAVNVPAQVGVCDQHVVIDLT